MLPYSDTGCREKRESKKGDKREEIEEWKWQGNRDKKNTSNRLDTGLRSAERLIKNRKYFRNGQSFCMIPIGA